MARWYGIGYWWGLTRREWACLAEERNVRAGGLKSRRTWALAGRCTARGSTEFEDGCLALIGKGHYLVKERNLACFLHVLADRDRQP